MSNETPKHDGMTFVRMLCAVVFCAFSFFYLLVYQGDSLMMAQHILSGGKTSYHHTVGAALITLFLFLLQLGAFAITKLTKSWHALTYFPSFLLLTVLTDVSPHIDEGFSFGEWLLAVPLLLLVFGVAVGVVRQFQPFETDPSIVSLFSKTMWRNIFLMVAMMVLTGMASNHNDVFHYRMRIENALLKGDYETAIRVGRKSQATDSSLTMLRAYALSNKRLLGEKLFEYPLVGKSKSLLPDGVTVKSMVYPYKMIGVFYKKPAHSTDFKLTSMLLDGNIDEFARLVSIKFPTDSLQNALPKHYREAMTLYTHMRSDRFLTYEDEVMEADYQDFLTIKRSVHDSRRKLNALRDKYANTYWYYFEENFVSKRK